MDGNATLDRLLAEAREDRDIVAVILFGSTARGEPAPSDLDVCLVLRADLRGVAAEKKRAAYLAHHHADVQVFRSLPLPVRQRVLKEGKILLSKDEDLLYDLAMKTIRENTYFRHAYETYLEGVRGS